MSFLRHYAYTRSTVQHFFGEKRGAEKRETDHVAAHKTDSISRTILSAIIGAEGGKSGVSEAEDDGEREGLSENRAARPVYPGGRRSSVNTGKKRFVLSVTTRRVLSAFISCDAPKGKEEERHGGAGGGERTAERCVFSFARDACLGRGRELLLRLRLDYRRQESPR